MRFDVLTIGAAVRDVYVHSNAFHVTDSSVVPGKKDACFVLGRKIEVDAPVFCTGGGATNAAATFGHLGLKVAPICKIGTDALASDVIRDLERHGVYTHALVRDAKTPTGYSVLLTAETGERTAIVYRGESRTRRSSKTLGHRLGVRHQRRRKSLTGESHFCARPCVRCQDRMESWI